MLTFRGIPGSVLMRDGAYREVTLTETQADSLLDVFQAGEARETFNELFDACRDAGFNPSTYGFKHLRLVSDNSGSSVLWAQLKASLDLINGPGDAA